MVVAISLVAAAFQLENRAVVVLRFCRNGYYYVGYHAELVGSGRLKRFVSCRDYLRGGLSGAVEVAKLWVWHVIDHFYLRGRQWGKDS